MVVTAIKCVYQKKKSVSCLVLLTRLIDFKSKYMFENQIQKLLFTQIQQKVQINSNINHMK